MVKRLTIGSGMDSIPTDTIPNDPAEFVAWFKGVGIVRWFGPADVRNVLQGSGIAITGGSFTSPPTIAISANFQALLAQPYVLVGAPVAGAALTDYRSIAAQSSVLNITDGGAESSITIGVATNGIGNAQFRQGAPLSVVGNAGASVANVADLTQAQLTSLINLASLSLSGAIPVLSGRSTDYLSGTGVFTALPTVTPPPVGANPTAPVGLSVVNGTATTYMRSDGAPPLSQAISPTMTGNWTFTPASGVPITVNGPAGAASLGIISANSATAVIADFFVWRAAGTANAVNEGPSLTVLETTAQVGGTLQASGGQIELWQITGSGPAARQIWKVLSGGGFVINAPPSGTPALINGATGASDILTLAAAAGTNAGVLGLIDGQTGTRHWQMAVGVAGAGIFSIRDVTAGSLDRMTIGTDGGFVFGGATGGDKGLGTINCKGLFVDGVAVTVP